MMIFPEGTTVATIIQTAVTPVFLIAGVAGLLNVFAMRLARIIDRLENLDSIVDEQRKLNPEYKTTLALEKRRDTLLLRMQNINRAIAFGTITGLLVALVILSVFASNLFSIDSGVFVSIVFILAMVFLALALVLFLREVFLSTSYIEHKKISTKSKRSII
jgi:tetrahydromethanopterin S-methyltransferase subunit B